MSATFKFPSSSTFPPSSTFPSSSTRPASRAAGFTLIEVLVVILIIVTLVGVVISIAQLAQNKSAHAQCVSEIAKWKDALETYKERKGDYPVDTNLDNSAGLQTVINTLYPTANDKHELTVRDPWGMEFRFRRVSKNRYELGSLGMDREYGAGMPVNAANFKFFGEGDDITIDNGRM